MTELLDALKGGRVLEAFGAGTACVVCPVGSLLYKGQVKDLTHLINATQTAVVLESRQRIIIESADVQVHDVFLGIIFIGCFCVLSIKCNVIVMCIRIEMCLNRMRFVTSHHRFLNWSKMKRM